MNRTLLYLLLGILLSVALSLIFSGFFLFLPLVFVPLAFRRRSNGVD